MITLATDKQVIETLLHLDEIKSQSARYQSVVIEYLIHKHGGLRKAARACGAEASNFANMRAGRRKASLELLARYLRTAGN